MNTFPPSIIPARPRVGRKRARVQSPAGPTPPTGPLTLLSVQGINLGSEGGDVTCVMDTTAAFPLADPSSADPSKWSVRYNDERYQGTGLSLMAFNQLRVHVGPPSSDTGAHSLSYSGPSDIEDTAGRMLAPVADFPL